MKREIVRFYCPEISKATGSPINIVKEVVGCVNRNKCSTPQMLVITAESFKRNGTPKCACCGRTMIQIDDNNRKEKE